MASEAERFTYVGDQGVLESRAGTRELLERFELDIALGCWERWRGANRMPAWREVDLLDLPPGLISGVMVADVVPGPPLDFHVRYWGTGLVEAFGFEASGRRLSEVEHFGIMDAFIAQSPRLIASGEHQIWVNRIEGRHRPAREFCVLRLPLGTDGAGVDTVMTVENIKASLRSPVVPAAAGRGAT